MGSVPKCGLAGRLIDDTKGKTMIEIAVQEIIEDKIAVDETPEKPFMPKHKI